MNISTRHSLYPAADLAARILLALIFIISGFGKITGYADTQGYMEAFGVPGMLLPLVIAAELGLGTLLIIGYRVRFAAAGLAAFSLVSGLIFHLDLGDPNQQIHLMKNLAITGGLILLTLNGAGVWSLDARRKP